MTASVTAPKKRSRRHTAYERKKPAAAEGFIEKECRQCFVKFKSPIQKGKPLYWLCENHRSSS